jgi:hypothetical protein
MTRCAVSPMVRGVALTSRAVAWGLGVCLCCSSTPAHAKAPPGPGPEPAPARAEPERPVAQPAPQPPEAPAKPWLPNVTLNGGIALYFYQPTNGWDNQFLIYTNLRFQARWDAFGLYFEPRLSNEKMRPYYDSLGWVHQAYLFYERGPFALKLGKLYKQVGLFWDNTFYGNIQVYEGLKFDPNSGASFELKLGGDVGAEVWAQYFVIDGHTNASLAGRDTISIPGARRRNTFSGRIQPFFRLSARARLEFGLSAEHFTADFGDRENAVRRLAGDVKLTWAGFGMWGEALHQKGANVTSYPYAGDPEATPPVPGRASADNTYLLAGAEYTLGPVTARYNLSLARYADVNVQEVLHVPGVGVVLHEHVCFLAEYAVWNRFTPEGVVDYDHSLNLTWLGYF